MELLQVMKNRRSVRKYTGDKVSQDKLDLILQAGLLAPSSKNIRPVELVVVEDGSMLEKLSESRQTGSRMLSKASCAIVVIADTREADAWIEDCSLVMGYMLLMAESLGIGGCWVQQRMRKTASGDASGDYVRELLRIPDDYEVEAILSLGIPQKTEEPRTWNESEVEKIHREKF